MNIEVRSISAAESGLGKAGGISLTTNTPARLSVLGDPALLRGDKLGLFCSVRCPGDLILKAYDLARKLRDDGVTVISGFHSPVEKECLRILMRGKQPIIICPARSLRNMRLPREWRGAIQQGRLLVVTPFVGSQKRATAELARERNRFVAAVADRVCFIHTAAGGALESLANELRRAGKSLVSP
ncbi:MAG TPA: DNA-processing protein DprA [Verrucomicrobiota bacterium]|jgi:predicted Rossmann fold nucleotide-binding protein DprA/Smf involved in DNA uptake|nr:DNA-processing protein DprA [Verrucomicrobiota bacterium]